MAPELEADIRRRVEFHRESETVRDNYMRAVADREALLEELDQLRRDQYSFKNAAGGPL